MIAKRKPKTKISNYATQLLVAITIIERDNLHLCRIYRIFGCMTECWMRFITIGGGGVNDNTSTQLAIELFILH